VKYALGLFGYFVVWLFVLADKIDRPKTNWSNGEREK